MGGGAAFAIIGVFKIANDWLPYRYFSLLAGLTTALGMLGAIAGEQALSSLFVTQGIGKTAIYAIVFSACLAFFMFFILKDKASKHLPHEKKLKNEVNNIFKIICQIAQNRQVIINSILGMLMYLPTDVFGVLWGVSFIQKTYHLTIHQSSSYSSWLFIGWIAGGPLMGYLSEKLQRRKIILQVSAFLSMLCAAILIWVTFDHLVMLTLMNFLLGFFSSAQILVFAVANDLAPDEYCATSIALTNFIISISGFIQPVVGFIIQYTSSFHPHHTITAHDYQLALSILPASLLLAFMISFALKETHCLKHQLHLDTKT